MVIYTARLRRALPLCFSLLHHHSHSPKVVVSPIRSISSALSAALNCQTSDTPHLSGLQSFRQFRSSPVSLSMRRERFDDDKEITEDTILFEGCDYNHWLITVDFADNIPAEEMVATYEHIAAQVFGSMEEAKKRIYACSTTVYQGFQVECSEETSEKFKDIEGVVFVLPDSYIDPFNKQYGGDKYINGKIIHMPPPLSYARRNYVPRPPRDDNFRPPQQRQNFGPPQNRPHQQNFGPPQNRPHQQNFGPPQNRPHQQNFTPSQNPQHQQNFAPPQNPPYQQNFAPPQNPSYQQNFAPPQNPQHQQNSNSPGMHFPQQNYYPPGGVGHNDPTSAPREQMNYAANGFSDQGRR